MTKIRYLDEEIQAVKDMYSRGFRIKDISVALNTQFHNGEEVRTYLGVKDCIKRNKIRSGRPKKRDGELCYCSNCEQYKSKYDFYIKSGRYEDISSMCKSCISEHKRTLRKKTQYEYKVRTGQVKVVCQHCFKFIGMIPIVNKDLDIKRTLKPNISIKVVLDANEELGTAYCSCGKHINLNQYYENWFK